MSRAKRKRLAPSMHFPNDLLGHAAQLLAGIVRSIYLDRHGQCRCGCAAVWCPYCAAVCFRTARRAPT
jgi:hypothetical protein